MRNDAQREKADPLLAQRFTANGSLWFGKIAQPPERKRPPVVPARLPAE